MGTGASAGPVCAAGKPGFSRKNLQNHSRGAAVLPWTAAREAGRGCLSTAAWHGHIWSFTVGNLGLGSQHSDSWRGFDADTGS